MLLRRYTALQCTQVCTLCTRSFILLLIAHRSPLGAAPSLPSRKPFGFASKSTGGSLNSSATYIVTNAAELKEALALPYTKTIYVKGVIHGNELADGAPLVY